MALEWNHGGEKVVSNAAGWSVHWHEVAVLSEVEVLRADDSLSRRPISKIQNV